jgi:hypothetical protein
MTRITAAAAAILAAIALAGCSPATKTASTGTAATEITVNASDTGCAVSTTKAAAGSYTFGVTNTGSKVTDSPLGSSIKVLSLISGLIEPMRTFKPAMLKMRASCATLLR